MRIALLSRNAALYSTSRLVLAGRARAHQVQVVDPLEIQIAVACGAPCLRYAGSGLPRYDAVIPRIGASITRYGLAVLEQLERGSAALLNGTDAIALTRDKVRSLQLLAANRIAVPRTVCIRSATGAEAAIELLGGCPVVVKLQRGTQGVGTMLAESRKALLSLVETFCAMGHEVVLQQYVRESRGRDVRALVVGGRVVAAMRRTAARGEFRSNLHRGASGEAVKLPARYRNCAVKAAKLTGLEVTGVDMLETAGGPILVELNSSPGLEGIERISQVDVATAIIEHGERLAAKRGTANKRASRAKSRSAAHRQARSKWS